MFSTLIKSLKVFITAPKNWLSFIAGLSLVFAYAPFSLWWLPFITIGLWLTIIDNYSPKESTKHGFIFGFGWFASGISWVHVAIDQFGGLPLVVSILLMVLLSLYLALFPALASYLSARLSTTKQFNVWLFSAFWLITEYLRGVLLTGFPWLSLGYTQINSPLASLIPVIGEFGLTSIVLITCVSIFQLVKRKNVYLSASILLSTLIITIFFSQITWVTPAGKSIKVALVQGNIKQEIKWAPEQEWPTMLKYLDLTRINYDADIIIWPESAITALEPRAQDFLTLANKSAALKNSAIITGILNYNYDEREYFNSLITLGKKHETDTEGSYEYNHNNRYSKYHLLPIGEFVPFQEWLRPIAPLFNLPQSSFSSGEYIQPNLVAKDINILPLICFEIAFPAQLRANFRTTTNLLLTVSNDSWFGDSHGPHQHLDIARMRAAEFGRPLLRSTNNGITAAIDHTGNIIATVPQFTENVLRAKINLVAGTTPYANWGQFTQWLIPLFTLLIYLFNARLYQRKTK
ncbi:apolipoprotein N-acyltransferase [Colwellia sp. UCD-KL20]|uniref:apolipoprotein N-acyltransferase n=1 Tax=Colwellia sp. UCD-KL20 TaxID=1917165 RepID=UPI000970665A|nr:apolipoprotein N-acyltransferase [Colwellia sp. UCD-KL20]